MPAVRPTATRSASLTAAAAALSAGVALAFANVPVGSVVEDVELPAVSGGRQHLVTGARANVFVFVKPGQEHSRVVLQQLAGLEKELAGKPVHWAVVVSGSVATNEAVAAVRAAGASMPVLVDVDDTLYGRLGIALEPVAGIVDSGRRLVAYQPFTQIGYADVLRARILRLLGEMTDQEVAQVVSPDAAPVGGDASVAHRRLRLAEKLFRAGRYESALGSIRVSLDKAPADPESWVLLGRILAAQTNRAEALKAFDAALRLDPTHGAALQARKACLEASPRGVAGAGLQE